MVSKSQIRKEVRRKRKMMSELDFLEKSERIHNRILSPSFFLPDTIGIYVSYNREVDTIQLIQQLLQLNKRVCVPKIVGQREMEFVEIHSMDDLSPGYKGILEPISRNQVAMNDIDLMFTPLVAFDANLNRIGQGGGFYDAFFKDFQGIKVGLAFEFQRYEFESEEHDQPLDFLISEKEIISLSNSRKCL